MIILICENIQMINMEVVIYLVSIASVLVHVFTLSTKSGNVLFQQLKIIILTYCILKYLDS